jgi:hypothetical protein
MRPTHYTEVEGGQWKKWKWGNVQRSELRALGIRGYKLLVSTDLKYGTIGLWTNKAKGSSHPIPQRIFCHTLRFDKGVVFDCLNGWRTRRSMYVSIANKT